MVIKLNQGYKKRCVNYRKGNQYVSGVTSKIIGDIK